MLLGPDSLDITQQALLKAWINTPGRSPLPDHVMVMLQAAATLQQSSQLAEAKPLPYDALLLQLLPRLTTAPITYYLTSGDILSMPRNELPALWAAMAAADVCVGLLWLASSQPEDSGTGRGQAEVQLRSEQSKRWQHCEQVSAIGLS
jgi:hypothetical protein